MRDTEIRFPQVAHETAIYITVVSTVAGFYACLVHRLDSYYQLVCWAVILADGYYTIC